MYTGPSSKTHLPISFRQLHREPRGAVRGPPSATAALRKYSRAYVQERAPIHQNLFCSLNWLSNATLYSEQREGAEREQPGLMLPENRTSEDGDGHDSSSDQTSSRSSSVYAKSSYLYGSEKGEETHNRARRRLRDVRLQAMNANGTYTESSDGPSEQVPMDTEVEGPACLRTTLSDTLKSNWIHQSRHFSPYLFSAPLIQKAKFLWQGCLPPCFSTLLVKSHTDFAMAEGNRQRDPSKSEQETGRLF